jgi:hypothetical protein
VQTCEYPGQLVNSDDDDKINDARLLMAELRRAMSEDECGFAIDMLRAFEIREAGRLN